MYLLGMAFADGLDCQSPYDDATTAHTGGLDLLGAFTNAVETGLDHLKDCQLRIVDRLRPE